MPETDWAPGTQARPAIGQVTWDADGHIDHVGVSVDIYLPSGRQVGADAFTWDRSDAETVAALDAAWATILAAVLAGTGLTLNHALGRRPVSSPVTMRPVREESSAASGAPGASP